MPPGRGGSHETLRRLNRLRVIDALRDEGMISRAEIARRTGLSRSTVSSLVGELQADGLVVERPEPAVAFGHQGGRPPVLLSFAATAGVAVGIDFGHHHVRVAVSDLSSRILAECGQPLDTDHQSREGLDAATALVEAALEEAGVEPELVIGAGMCLPGPIDRAADVSRSATILPDWADVHAAEEMRRRLGVPMLVDNDANLAALAEAAFGAGRDAKDLVYVMASAGIGAGLVLNGRLYRGAGGLAGEVGHVLVAPDGPVCRCGNRGCLETIAGTDALAARLRGRHGDGLDGRAIVALALAGDVECAEAITEAGRAIGTAAATLVNVLNPELVVIGGDLAGAGELLLSGVRETLARAALPASAESATVVVGSLGDRAEVLGAIALVLSEAEREHPLRTVAMA